jgi:hypothetical protein
MEQVTALSALLASDGYFNLADVSGDGVADLTTPFTEDTSYEDCNI